MCIRDSIYASDEVYCQFDPVTYIFTASDKGGYEVSITGTGQAMDIVTYEPRNATITGKISIPIIIEVTEIDLSLIHI